MYPIYDSIFIEMVESAEEVQVPKGHVFGWGPNLHSQVGIPTGDKLFMVPTLICKKMQFTNLSTFCNSTMGVASTGDVYAWGNNGKGRIGFGAKETIAEPKKVPHLKNIVTVSCGQYHSLALDVEGRVYSCGRNKNGEMAR
jgi:alpha-tubulin suppressor-like RCC1 family protein